MALVLRLCGESLRICDHPPPLFLLPPPGRAVRRSIFHSERRAVFGPRFPAIVEPGCADMGVTKPSLDVGQVGSVFQGVGGGGGAQGVQAQPIQRDAGLPAVNFHHRVDAVSGDGLIQLSRHVVAGGAEESPVLVVRPAGGQGLANRSEGHGGSVWTCTALRLLLGRPGPVGIMRFVTTLGTCYVRGSECMTNARY